MPAVLPHRSRFPRRPSAALAVGLLLAGTALPALAQPADNTGAAPSSGQVVTGLAGSGNPGSKVAPSHPAPSSHVRQPSTRLRSDPNVTKEQVAPTPGKPGLPEAPPKS